MFPLAVPGMHWLAYRWGAGRELGRAVVQTLVLVALVAVGVFLLFQFPESRSGIEQYLHQQLMARLGLERERGAPNGIRRPVERDFFPCLLTEYPYQAACVNQMEHARRQFAVEGGDIAARGLKRCGQNIM